MKNLKIYFSWFLPLVFMVPEDWKRLKSHYCYKKILCAMVCGTFSKKPPPPLVHNIRGHITFPQCNFTETLFCRNVI